MTSSRPQRSNRWEGRTSGTFPPGHARHRSVQQTGRSATRFFWRVPASRTPSSSRRGSSRTRRFRTSVSGPAIRRSPRSGWSKRSLSRTRSTRRTMSSCATTTCSRSVPTRPSPCSSATSTPATRTLRPTRTCSLLPAYDGLDASLNPYADPAAAQAEFNPVLPAGETSCFITATEQVNGSGVRQYVVYVYSSIDGFRDGT